MKSRVSLSNKHIIAIKPAMHQNSAVSKALITGKNLKLVIINTDFESCKLLHSSVT